MVGRSVRGQADVSTPARASGPSSRSAKPSREIGHRKAARAPSRPSELQGKHMMAGKLMAIAEQLSEQVRQEKEALQEASNATKN